MCCELANAPKEEARVGSERVLFYLLSTSFHRYCGSVTEQQHKAITDSQRSFLCPCCDRERRQVEITEPRDTVEAMKMELAQLKDSLATLSAVQTEMASATSRSYASSASAYSGSGSGSYASAAKRSNLGQSAYGRRTRGRQPSNDADSATKKAKSSNVSATEPAVPAGKRPKIQVVGARRIWGTLRDSTVNSVKNVISRICKLENGIRVRRKTKVSPVTNKRKWWYVVHADEDLLTELNTKWDQVKVQTSWKLEPCFMFSNSEGNNATASQSQSHESAQQVHDNEGIVHNVDSSDNEQEFITPVVACSGDENDTANAQAVSNDDNAVSLTTPFLEV